MKAENAAISSGWFNNVLHAGDAMENLSAAII